MLNNFSTVGSNAALLLEEHIEAQQKKHTGIDRISYISIFQLGL